MHVTLHLTTGCNLNCGYCYAPPIDRTDMSEEVARKAVEYGSSLSPSNTGIIFFGGEPMLKKELIKSVINYSNERCRKYNYQNHFKVTTNGLLLDVDFLKYCREVKLTVGMSFDGIKEAHDRHRKYRSGKGSFDIVDSKVDLLMKYQPYSSILMVITPETVKYYYESVKYLFDKGVKYIIASLNYAGSWTESELHELKMQYHLLSKLYEEMIMKEKKFYFSPFEMKFASHIRNEDGMCEKCHLGMKQISVDPEGLIYPCVQFVNRKEYVIGDVWHGIDEIKRRKLYDLSLENQICCECKMQQRCNHSCSCLNVQTTGILNKVSPFLCESEKLLVTIVDKLGERLFHKRAPMFIQKHYNSVYPVLSLLEDQYQQI